MSKLIERLRWRIATLVSRLPGQCWADLAGWVTRDRRDDPDWRSSIPWRPVDDDCRRGVSRFGACYCGKLRAKDEVAS